MTGEDLELCPHCLQAIAPKTTVLIDNYEFDPVEGSISNGETNIHLTRYEARLFEALMRAKGRVASKSFIYDSIWGLESEIDQKIIDVYVCKIRRKIRHTQLGIETIWGRGFRLIVKQQAA
jgi:DNA-binding response OmpR family regulator